MVQLSCVSNKSETSATWRLAYFAIKLENTSSQDQEL